MESKVLLGIKFNWLRPVTGTVAQDVMNTSPLTTNAKKKR
jgi:hypothetical protein